jgi:hypothetical protein
VNPDNETAPAPDLWRLFSIYRDYVEHEDSLINQRVTWFLATQALFFYIYGFFLLERIKPRAGGLSSFDFTDVQGLLKTPFFHPSINFDLLMPCIICYFGFFASLRSYQSIMMGHRAIGRLREKWEVDVLGAKGAKHKLLPDLCDGVVKKTDSWRFLGYSLTSVFIPASACWFWAGVLFLHVAFIR